MTFYPNQLFHIYNRGHDRQLLFHSDENYRYFLWKMRTYLLPFGDIIAWCLMPNHFHWLFYVKSTAVRSEVLWQHVDQVEWLRRQQKYGKQARQITRKRVTREENSSILLNDAIGYLENTYSQAINRYRQSTGTAFNGRCKAKNGWIDEFAAGTKANGKLDTRFMPGSGYAYRCFVYIHQNPVEPGLATQPEDWRYSSARDYAEMRKGTLCNINFGRELMKYL